MNELEFGVTSLDRWAMLENLVAWVLVTDPQLPHAAALCSRCPKAFAVPLYTNAVQRLDPDEALARLELDHALAGCDGPLYRARPDEEPP